MWRSRCHIPNGCTLARLAQWGCPILQERKGLMVSPIAVGRVGGSCSPSMDGGIKTIVFDAVATATRWTSGAANITYGD